MDALFQKMAKRLDNASSQKDNKEDCKNYRCVTVNNTLSLVQKIQKLLVEDNG